MNFTILYVLMNFSPQECKPLVILHLGYIDFPSYVAVVSFHNLNLPKGIQISDIDFQVRLYRKLSLSVLQICIHQSHNGIMFIIFVINIDF